MSITKTTSDGNGAQAIKKRKPSHPESSNNFNGNATVSATSAGPTKSFMMDHLTKELLAEVQPNYELQHSRVEETLEKIIKLIEKIPSRPLLTTVEAEKSLRKSSGVAVPFPEPKPGEETHYRLEFEKPESVNLVGSFASKLYLKGPRTIDMVVTMPASILQKKDYLNHRAFHKRAFYLACIANGIEKGADDVFSMSYEYQDDIILLPVLIISPKSKSNDVTWSKIRVRILVGFPDGTIPIDKTLPTKNCVRPPGGASAEDTLEPTPFYNSCLRVASSFQTYQHMTAKISEKCPAFADACRLGRVWLRQRNKGSPMSKDGFGSCEWSILCALLFKSGGHKGRPLLSVRFSSLQIFKVMLHFLAESDLTKPVIIDAPGMALSKSDLPVVYDGASGVNVLFKMTPWSYQSLKTMAAQSLVAVNGSNLDSFETTFISKIDENFLRSDEIFSVDLSAIDTPVSDGRHLGLAIDIHRVLYRGFGDRVKRLEIQLPTHTAWNIKEETPMESKPQTHIAIHLLLNPEASTRLVDRGPSAEDPDASAEFRQFWGLKAELRRFKDGTISESLVWTEGTPVTMQIVQHLLQHRFNIPAHLIPNASNSHDLESQMPPSSISNLTATDTFRLIHKTYQDLSNTLLQIKELPLRIKTTAPLDAALGSTAIDLSLIHPVNMSIEFEDSPRWPDTVAAIEHTKTAFLIKLADALDESNPHLTTRVGLENQSRTTCATDQESSYLFNRAFLDVIYPSPGSGIPKIPFRIRINNPRTTHLLQTILSDLPSNKTERALTTAALTASFLPTHLTAHTLALRTLTSTDPTLCPTIRLLKHWTASHLLSRHIPPQLIDIIALAALPIPQTGLTPGSATLGFFRCLSFLKNWDWVTTPLNLSLDPHEPLTREQGDKIQTHFAAWRKADPAMHRVAVVIGTNLDETGVLWTLQQPHSSSRHNTLTSQYGVSAVIMKRWCALASHTLSIVSGRYNTLGEDGTDAGAKANWQSEIFNSPLGDYDFLIHLKRQFSPRQKKLRSADVKFKNLALPTLLDDASIGFDAAGLFTDDLETAFGDAALFFCGEGRVIAGLWRPDVLGRRKTKVDALRFGYPVKLVGEVTDGEADVVINQASILSQIAQMGSGMVERVEKVKEFVA